MRPGFAVRELLSVGPGAESAAAVATAVATASPPELIGSESDVSRVAFGDVTMKVEDIVIDTENAAAVLIVTSQATHRGDIFGLPGSGRRVETQMMFLFRLSDGRIASERRLYDFTGLLVQLGVLRTKHV